MRFLAVLPIIIFLLGVQGATATGHLRSIVSGCGNISGTYMEGDGPLEFEWQCPVTGRKLYIVAEEKDILFCRDGMVNIKGRCYVVIYNSFMFASDAGMSCEECTKNSKQN